MIPSPTAYSDWKRWAEALYKHFATQRPTGRLPIHTVSNLPPPTAAGLIYVSDETGGAVPAFSDGTNWRRVTDRVVVS